MDEWVIKILADPVTKLSKKEQNLKKLKILLMQEYC